MKSELVPYYDEFKKLIDDPLPEMKTYFEEERQYLLHWRERSDMTAIDVGCGPGRLLQSFGTRVKSIVGVDKDPRMIEAAREATKYFSGTYEFWVADFLKLWPFPWRRADIVFASYNLPGDHGMYDDLRLELLRQMVRFTELGGHTIVSFWKPTNDDWLEHYYARAGIKVRKFCRDNVVRTSAGTFKRFTSGEIDDLAIRVGVNYRRVELTPMWDLVHFFRPKS